MYILKSFWQLFLQQGGISFRAYKKCVSVSFPLHMHQHWVLSFVESLCQVVPCHCVLNVSFIEGALCDWIENNPFTATQRWPSYGCFL